MTSRGRGGSFTDWDPMRDEFNDTTYNAQYPDDDASEGVQLDHTKLYITKLPALSQEGMINLFSKFGNVVHSYFSRDPVKKYAFVQFETAGEARIAMMKLNKTEPFNMSIYFAHHKNPKTQQSQQNIDRSNSNTDRAMNRHSTERHSHNSQEAVSVSSRGKKPRNIEEHANGTEECDDSDESDVGQDPKLGYDLEKIKLQRLQIMDQQLQVQQRMLIHQQRMKSNNLPVTKRRLLPDGRSIQVTQDNETSFTTGGGDSNTLNVQRNIPGLQREPSRQCVECGAPAGLFCAGCRVTPYCGERCQRRDWEPRHRSVCHNLARSSAEVDDAATIVAPEVPAVSQLRHPHSPSKKLRDPLYDSIDKGNKNLQKANQSQLKDNQSNVVPNGNRNQQPVQNRNQQPVQNRNQQPVQSRNQQVNARSNLNKDGQNRNPVSNMRAGYQNNVDEGQHQPLRQPKPEPKPEPTVETKPKPRETKSVLAKPVPVSLSDDMPKLVPTNYLVEKLKVGMSFLAEVQASGTKQAEYICLTLHDNYQEEFNSLCAEFTAECEKDSEEYTPRIGETFAYLCEDEGDWYRARCLARTRAALLDAGRVVSFTPASSRRLPDAFANIPEFMAVLKCKDINIGDNFNCEVLSAAPNIRVSLTNKSGKTVEADVSRWLPEVEDTEPQRAIPQKEIKEPIVSPQTQKPAAIRKPLVPANYVIEKLAEGAAFVASVVALATECASKQPGYVCLTANDDYSEHYESLCGPLTEACEGDSKHYTPSIGETFAYLCEDDNSYYRARCLARTRAALLDAGRVVSFTPASSRRLPDAFANIPEFMVVFKAKSLTIGEFVNGTILSAASDSIQVSIEESTGRKVQAEAMRWQPEIEYPTEPVTAPKPAMPPTPATQAPKPATTKPIIPEVPRPDIHRNTEYTLLDVTSLRRAYIRPSDPRLAAMFDSVLHDTLLYGLTASPLKEPPQKGQTVVAKFMEDDGNHYRAFVKRVNVAMNKYLIEYIEYGNEEIVPLERLYPCPPKLQIEAKPTQASLIKLSDREPATLTPAAINYINNLKDNAVGLILNIPGGANTAPSGSLASLLLAKGSESASKEIEELCTPEWKKVAERNGDVLELESCFYHDNVYVSLPMSGPFTYRVTFCDADTLAAGALSGHEKGDKAAEFITELTKQIEEYCASSLCKEPYLPKIEELCITKHPRSGAWVRAVLVEITAGASFARVLLLDTGELCRVAVRDLRRLPRELAAPKAIGLHADLADFPTKVSRSQIESAMRYMRIDANGTGELRVTSCRLEDNMYEICAPDLIAAMNE